MNEAIYGLIGVGVGGGLTFFTTWFLHRQQIKEQQRISENTKYDIHSRVFRKITYLIEKYIIYTKRMSYQELEQAYIVSERTDELINAIESMDDSVLDGEGIMYFYAILKILNEISQKTVLYETRLDEHSGELVEIPHSNEFAIQQELIKLESLNNTIISQHISKYAK